MLNKRVELQERFEEKSRLNQSVGDFQTIRSLWVQIKPVSSSADVNSSAVVSDVTHEIKMHFREGVRVGMRFKRKSRIFDIVDPPINEREENRFLICPCKELVANG